LISALQREVEGVGSPDVFIAAISLVLITISIWIAYDASYALRTKNLSKGATTNG
jgi:hypothetical protein